MALLKITSLCKQLTLFPGRQWSLLWVLCSCLFSVLSHFNSSEETGILKTESAALLALSGSWLFASVVLKGLLRLVS